MVVMVLVAFLVKSNRCDALRRVWLGVSGAADDRSISGNPLRRVASAGRPPRRRRIASCRRRHRHPMVL